MDISFVVVNVFELERFFSSFLIRNPHKMLRFVWHRKCLFSEEGRLSGRKRKHTKAVPIYVHTKHVEEGNIAVTSCCSKKQ